MALGIRYRPAPDDRRQITRTLAAMRHALWKLGAVVPPGMTRVLAHGSSIHYAGTLPMTPDARPFTTSPEGRSRDMVNLSIADGAAFPFLPAKNLTYTLMANAVRIASALAS
jgi:choline dehydrogenase-like flavoprotein